VDQTLRKGLAATAETALEEGIRIKDAMLRSGIEGMLDMAELIAKAFRGRHRLFLFGNGGSAADAQHIAAEFVNRFQRERPPLPAIALTVDTSVLTSISNDFHFDEVFLKQLKALGEPGDIALGISTSGRSPNVLKALRWAREHGMGTIGWAGKPNTEMDVYCDLIFHVDSDSTPRIQECHITAGHIVCELVDEMLFGIGEGQE
jgi:D-sedoheptulose 7-phosphate isomerase